MKTVCKISAWVLGLVLLLGLFPMQVLAAENTVLADWHLDKSSVKSGSIEKGDLVLADASGHGNDLYLTGHNAKKYLEFTEDKMYDGTAGSLRFNNEKQRILGRGVEFLTGKDAPINKETFDNGYTIELIYQLPKDFAAEDSWMGLLARKGKCNTQTDTKKCTMGVAVSNCKEIQFLTANKNDSHAMESACWSLTMDKGGLWYHIVITSDGQQMRTFVNGCDSFRDYESDQMVGMMADPSDGRFVVGGYNNGLLNHYGRGTLQQVRISAGALPQAQWLIADHDRYVEDFGVNLPFTKLSSTAYNMIFLPDIQNAVQFRPQVLNTAAAWICDHRALVNPAAIISLGDNVNDYDDAQQWNRAKAFYALLEKIGVPILQQPGNHDYGDNYYLDAFGPQAEFGKRQAQRGVVYSPSGYSSYMLYDAGSYRYLAVNISMEHIGDDRERAWFTEVLESHKKNPTIVTSHNFQDVDAAVPNLVNLSTLGKDVWTLIKPYDQVFMMISGHNHGAGEEVLKNNAGHEVYSVMADYQFTYNGGNAFFKFAEFDEAHNKIRLSTFSPYAATLKDNQRTFFDVNYMTGLGNYTLMHFDFAQRFAGMESSKNVDAFAKALEKAKAEETDVQELQLDGAAEYSAADAHEVNNKLGEYQVKLIKIGVTAGVVLLAVIVLIVVLIIKKHRRKKAAQPVAK